MGLFSAHTKRGVVMLTDSALRFVYARTRTDGTVDVLKTIEQRIPSGIVMGGVIEQPQLFREVLVSFRKKLPTRRIHLLVPEESSMVVTLDRPTEGFSEKTLERVVRGSIERKLSDAALPTDGFEVLSITDDGMRLFVDIVSSSLMDTYRDTFQQAGYNVRSVDTPHPDWAVHHNHAETSRIMVGFGERTTSIVLLNGGVVVMKSVVPVGRADLVETVRTILGVQTHEAQRIISRYGVSREHREDAVLAAIHALLQPLEDELTNIVRTWQVKPYKTARERLPLSSTMLYGEVVDVPGLQDHIARISRIETEYIDIPATINAPELAARMSKDEMIRFAPVLWKVHELTTAR